MNFELLVSTKETICKELKFKNSFFALALREIMLFYLNNFKTFCPPFFLKANFILYYG